MSLDFEASAFEYVDVIGAQSHLQNVAGATIMAWVLPETVAAGSGVIAGFSVGTSNNSRHAIERSGALATVVSRRLDADAAVETDGGTLAAATLAHIAGVAIYNGASQLLYVNGVQVASSSPAGWTGNTSNTTSTSAAIAVNEDLGSSWFDGRLQDVRVYNRALSADEINDIFLSRGRDSIVLGLQSRIKLLELQPGGSAAGAGFVKDTGVQQPTLTPVATPTYAEWLVSSRRRRTG